MSTAPTSESSKSVSSRFLRRLGQRAPIAVAAILAPLVVWLFALIADLDMNVVMPDGRELDVGPIEVLVASSFAVLAGWAGLQILEVITTKAMSIWTIVAIVLLLASFVPVVSVEAGVSAKVALGAMHVAVAAVLIPGFRATRWVR